MNTIVLYRPNIYRADLDSVLRCLLDDALGKESITQLYSRKLADYCNMHSAYALRSYKSAIEHAFRSLKLSKGARVVLSPLAPLLYRDILLEHEMEILYVDVDKAQPLLPSPQDYDYKALSPDAMVLDAPLGLVADLANFKELGVPIIEDVSVALASTRLDLQAGSIGKVVILSTEPQDMLTTGGGAALLFRMNPPIPEPKAHDLLPALNSSLGLTQLARLPQQITRKKDMYAQYDAAIKKSVHATIEMPVLGVVFHRYPVQVRHSIANIFAYAKKQKIEIRYAFEHWAGQNETNMPNAKRFVNQLLLLPYDTTLAPKDVESLTSFIASM